MRYNRNCKTHEVISGEAVWERPLHLWLASSLKTKLDVETNATAAREDVRNIFLEFRIYLVVIPRDLRQVHVDLEENLKDAMKDMESTLQTAITDLGINS